MSKVNRKKRFKKIGLIAGWIILLLILGTVYLFQIGVLMSGEAEKYYRKLSDIKEKFNGNENYKASDSELLQLDSSIHFFKTAKQNNYTGFLLGLAYFLRANTHLSYYELTQALEDINLCIGFLRSKKHDAKALSDSYNVAAIIYHKLGDYDLCTQNARLAIDALGKDKSDFRHIMLSVNLADFENQRSNYPEAKKILASIESDMDIFTKKKNLENFEENLIAKAYLTFSEVFLQSGIHYENTSSSKEAKEEFEKGLAYFQLLSPLLAKLESREQHIPLGNIWYIKSVLEANLNRPHEAEKAIRQSLIHFSKGNDREYLNNKGLALTMLAYVLAESDKLVQAQDTLMHGMELMEFPIQDFWSQDLSGLNLVSRKSFVLAGLQRRAFIAKQIYQKKPNQSLQEQIFSLELTNVAALDSIRLGFVTDEGIASFSAGFSDIFQPAIQSAYELYRETGEDIYLEHLHQLSQKNRSFVLRLNMNRRSIINELPVFQHYDSLKTRGYELNARLQGTKENSSERLELLEQLNQHTRQLNAFFYKIKSSQDADDKKLYDSMINYYIPSIEEIRENYCQDDATMVVSYLLGEIPMALCITKKGVRICLLDLPDNWKKYYNDYNFHFTSERETSFEVAAKQMYNFFIAPLLEQKTPIKRLRILPDGVLKQTSFAAFINPNENSLPGGKPHYLIHDFALNYLYFLENKSIDDINEGASESKMAFTINTGASDLPMLKNLASELATNNPDWKIFKNSSKGTFLHEAPNSSVVFLVAHALADLSDPLNSYIDFSLDRSKDQEKLTQAELYTTRFSTDLLIMGSCQTGKGNLIYGDEVASLSRALYQGGCKGLIATLDNLNDACAAEIYRDFISGIENNLAVDVSLQNAITAYINRTNGVRSDPRYWASIISIGRIAPIAP